MAVKAKTLKTCKNGHQYYKSGDCPVCPICEKEKKLPDNFLSVLAAPARRTLQNNGITSLRRLSSMSEKEILAFHGMGQASLPVLRELLAKNGLTFNQRHGKTQ